MERTLEAEHQRLMQLAHERGCPPPPGRPGPGECCDGDCDPCLWDYYERALTRWRDRNAIGDWGHAGV